MHIGIFQTLINKAEILRSFWIQTSGAIAVAFAVMSPMLVGATGMALDLGQSFLVKQRLAGALDSAALAAASSETSQDGIEAMIDEFMQANYPDGKIGEMLIDNLDVTVDGDDVTVTARARYDTTFMRLLGIDELYVDASTTIHRAIKGLEVVMVLDNTGSMGTTNMNALKDAATSFVEILFDRVQDSEDIKIGIVPYASSVRIGFYGLGLVPDDDEFDTNGWSGSYETYGDGDVFVTLPSGVNYITRSAREGGGSGDNGWYGCVVEHNANGYDSDATHVPGSYGQLWSTHSTAGQCSAQSTCRGHGWDPGSSSNDPADDDSTDDYTGPWDIYMYGEVITEPTECTDLGSGWSNSSSRCSDCNGSGGNCASEYCYCMYSNPTTSCPYAYVQPMISDEDDLLAHIQTMRHNGATYSNIGMLWGLRLISPEEPFTEGVEYDDEEWNKAIVMMTDGEMSPSSRYSVYWDADRTNIDTVNELNSRLSDTCDLIKSNGVIIYTVTFDHATSDISDATKDIYEDCATSTDHYYDAPTSDELNNVFEEISAALARLHISE